MTPRHLPETVHIGIVGGLVKSRVSGVAGAKARPKKVKEQEVKKWRAEYSDYLKKIGDFPGGAVVKNPPANAGGHGFDPWSGKIPTCCGATKPVRHNY